MDSENQLQLTLDTIKKQRGNEYCIQLIYTILEQLQQISVNNKSGQTSCIVITNYGDVKGEHVEQVIQHMEFYKDTNFPNLYYSKSKSENRIIEYKEKIQQKLMEILDQAEGEQILSVSDSNNSDILLNSLIRFATDPLSYEYPSLNDIEVPQRQDQIQNPGSLDQPKIQIKKGFDQPSVNVNLNKSLIKMQNSSVFDQDHQKNILNKLTASYLNDDPHFSIFQYSNSNQNQNLLYQDIKQCCSTLKTQYVDEEFPPRPSSIVGSDNKHDPLFHKLAQISETCVWLRPGQFMQTYQLFGEFSVNDINQGLVGNCFFLCALGNLIYKKPDLIKRLFDQKETNEQGVYSIWICDSGLWKNIIIDDTIPCYSKQQGPIFTKPSFDEIWCLLLEKAYAKIYNGYSNISTGYIQDGMRTLTGAPTQNISIDDLDQTWRKLIQFHEQKYIMSASSINSDDVQNMMQQIQISNNDIIPSHAYSIIDIFEMQDEDGSQIRRIKMRNPWGGKHSFKHNCNWSAYQQKVLNNLARKNTSNGSFWIDYLRFIQYFVQFTVCKVEDNYHYSQYLVEHKNQISPYNLIKLIVTEQSKVYIQLIQRNARHYKRLDSQIQEYMKARMMVYKVNEGRTPFQIIDQIQNKSEVLLSEQTLQPGQYFIASTVNQRAGLARDYVVSTYSKEPVILEEFQFDWTLENNPFSLIEQYLPDQIKSNVSLQKTFLDKTAIKSNVGEELVHCYKGKYLNYIFLIFENLFNHYKVTLKLIFQDIQNLVFLPPHDLLNNHTIQLEFYPKLLKQHYVIMRIDSDHGAYQYNLMKEITYVNLQY